VVHFVGDVHQPLHAEDHSDKRRQCSAPSPGSASEPICIAIWDTNLIEDDDPDAGVLAKQFDRRITSTQDPGFEASKHPTQS